MYLTGCHLAIDLPEAVWREFAGSDVPDDTSARQCLGV